MTADTASWDLIVVGGGAAGMAAAIFAAERTSRVLLIDHADVLGGTLWVANGQLSAAVSSAVGLAVNDQLQVIRPDGSAIPGLWAAGELLGASQTMGRAVCGGMMATPALTFGRLLGQSLIPLTSRT